MARKSASKDGKRNAENGKVQKGTNQIVDSDAMMIQGQIVSCSAFCADAQRSIDETLRRLRRA